MNAPQQIRYAVVSLGHIAQVAILPAFENAGRNSELCALVSGNEEKLRVLGKRYDIPDENLYSTAEYEDCLKSGKIDAVYIAAPNSLHHELALKAAQNGIHVLCEKPLTASVKEAEDVVDACREHKVKLMTAYRLHFEEANMTVVELVKDGKIGEPRIFNSVFSMQVKDGDVRLKASLGGGTAWDLGIYCINAARYLFRAEPVEVMARSLKSDDPRFNEVEEMLCAHLVFPGDRIANFVCSFGAAPVSRYKVVGTKGSVQLENAYEYVGSIRYTLERDGDTQEEECKPRDQFAPEIIHFSDAILNDEEPGPSGLEGLADVRIIDALYRSAKEGEPVTLEPTEVRTRPDHSQVYYLPPVEKVEPVEEESPGE